MKKIIFALLPTFVCCTAFSQDIFYQGGWKTNDANQTTTLVIDVLASPKIFEITSTSLDKLDVKFQFVADNVALSSSFLPEGSFAVVEAKKLLIKQINTGVAFVKGNWKVITPDSLPFKQFQWQSPQTGGRITLASFSNSTEFVLSFFEPVTACTTAKMVIYIDGAVVPAQFLTGSSVIGRGKKLEVEILNACPGNVSYGGSLKYRI